MQTKNVSPEDDAKLMTSQKKVLDTKDDCPSGNVHEGTCAKNLPEENEEPEPPDGGWGWCIIFANALCAMMMTTQGPCFGIFYGERLRELGGTPALAAWLFNFQSLVWNLAGPWAGLLSERFSYRPVAMVSAFVASSSLILSSMVTNPYLFFLTFSLLSGVGGGICINCCYHMSAIYFKKRLGLANGIMVTGGSLGLMLMPQMASYLQHLFPFEWAAIIAGAVMMNSVAVTALFHPVEWHRKKSLSVPFYSPLPTSEDGKKEDQFEIQIRSPSNGADGGFSRCSSVPHPFLGHGQHVLRTRSVSESPYYDQGHQYVDDRSRDFNFQPNGKSLSSVFQYGSSTFMGSVLTLQQPKDQLSSKQRHNAKEDIVYQDTKEAEQGIWKKFLSHYKLSVLQDPLVISVALCTCVTITSAINILSTMPFLLNEAGYSLQSAAYALSTAAIADLATRMLCAATTDRSWVKPRILYALAQILSVGAPMALITVTDQWTAVLVSMSVMGVGLGILYVMDVFIIVRVLGVSKLQSVFGISQLFRVFAFGTFGPVGGLLRNTTGTYASAIIFYICNICLGFLILIFTAFYHRCWPKTRIQDANSKETGQ